jgi:carbamoyl-phosphate synthase large subunit
MLGASIAQLRTEGLLPATGDGGDLPIDAPVSVKEAILPFKRFRTRDGRVVDSVLGPEMRSTGEVMGIDTEYGTAFAKTQMGSLWGLPTAGRIFVSVANRDKRAMVFPIKRLADLGFELLATQGTADVLRRNGITAGVVRKHSDGPGPNGEPTIVQRITAGDIAMVVNTPGSGASGRSSRADGYAIRTATTSMDRPIITTVQQLGAAVHGIEAILAGPLRVRSLQDHARAMRGQSAQPTDEAMREDMHEGSMRTRSR